MKCEVLWGDFHNDDDAPEATGVAICGSTALLCCDLHSRNCSGRENDGWTYLTLDEIASCITTFLLRRSRQ